MPTGELALFKAIWAERPHRSDLSGMPIHYFSVSNFAHLLPKGQHSQARLDPDNIILLTTEEHFLLDQGTHEQRQKYARMMKCSWDEIRNMKIRLLKRYYPELNKYPKTP